MTDKAQTIELPPVRFDVTEAAIQEMEAEYMGLTIKGIEDKGGLASIHEARMVVRGHRIAVEKSRKVHNNGAQEFIRHNNAAAKTLISRLRPIEDHLQAEEDKVLAEKARIKEEAALEARAKVQNRIDAMAEYDAHLTVAEAMAMEEDSYQETLAIARDLWEIERARLAEERKQREEVERIEQEARNVEAARMEEEAARMDMDRAVIEAEREKNRLEQEEATQKLQDEKDALEVEKQALENDKIIEAARVEAAAKAVQDEKARAEKARLDAIEAKRQEAEENERQEALRPDREKLEAMATEADALAVCWSDVPLSDERAAELCDDATLQLSQLAAYIEKEAESL